MTILIVYGTNSGGTKEVAEYIAQECSATGYTIKIQSAEYTTPEDLKGYDCLLLGSCTWEMITPTKRFEGQLQQHMAKLREGLKGMTMPGQKIGIFALGDSTYTNFCIAANHLEALVKQMQATQVGETLRIDSYFFDVIKNRAQVQAWTKRLLQALNV